MQKILTRICIFLLFFYFFILFFRPITAINEDLGRHLLLGKIIVQTNTVPPTNLLSFTFPQAPFINSHWLSEVVFYLIQKSVGFEGLLIFTTTLSLLTLFLIFHFLAKRFSLAALILPFYLAVCILIERTDIRPEMFSFFFLVLFVTSLYRYRERYTKWIFLLIPLQMLWTNMHIYFFTGIVVLFLFFADHLFLKKSKRSIQTLGMTLIGASIATLFNPYGIYGALFPITVQQNYGFPVIENQSFFYLFAIINDPTLLYFLITCLLFVVLFIFARKKTTPVDLLLFLFFAAFTFVVYRNVPLFVYAILIPLTAMLSYTSTVFLTRLKKRIWKTDYKLITTYLLVMFIVSMVGHVGKTLQYRPVGLGLDAYHQNAVDFLLQKQLPTPLYNNFDIGGYLSYRIYPQKVFMDNRPEAYPKEFAKKTYFATYNPDFFAEFEKQFDFQTLILSHWDRTMTKNKQLISLLNDKNFTLVYLDDTTLIFVKNASANEKIIQQYKVTPESFSPPKNLEKLQLMRYYYFFEKVGWEKPKKKVYQQLLLVDPKGCTLKRGMLYLKKENPLSFLTMSGC
jgi:hypothetical protein